jgi:hypothetical protein
VNRLDLQAEDESQGLPELMESVTSGGAKSKTEGAIEGVKEKLGMGEDEEDREKEESRPRRRSSSRSRRRKDGDE